MMNTIILLGIHAAIIIAVVVMVSLKYGTVLHPVSFFGAQFFLWSVLSPLLYLKLKLFGASRTTIDQTVLLSSLYFATLGIAYWLEFSPLRSPMKALVRVSRPFIIASRSDLAGLGLAVLALQFVAIYITLMVTSGAGFLWLTDTREAYQHYKGGVGVWWSLAQATLLLLFVAGLFRREHTRRKVVVETLFFSATAFFLGSKAGVLAYPILATFYVHFCIRRVRTGILLIGPVLLLLLAMALQLIQRTAGSIFDALKYFDYFNYSAAFLDHFRHRDFQYGKVTISNLWFYVPRGLYSAKPFTYGQNTLLTWIRPGFESVVRRTGYTPGMLPWSVGYADFGVIGVAMAAAITAWISKVAFEYFLEQRDFLSFFLMVQIGFIYSFEAFPNAPFPIFWAWLMTQCADVLAAEDHEPEIFHPCRRGRVNACGFYTIISSFLCRTPAAAPAITTSWRAIFPASRC